MKNRFIVAHEDYVAGVLVGHRLVCHCGWEDKSGYPFWSREIMRTTARAAAEKHNEIFHVGNYRFTFRVGN